MRALASNPNDPPTLANMGIIFYEWTKYVEATEKFDQGLKIDRFHVPCLYCKGMALEKLGKIGEAEEFIEKAQEINPTYSCQDSNQPACYSPSESPI
jgi:tetratricopeptide (TPR) repeat protein